MTVEVSSVCERGLKRPQNQDSILVYRSEARNFALFLVADGMGGYANGELASGAIAEGMREWIMQTEAEATLGTLSKLLASLRERMAAINQNIWRKQWSQSQICGSTCVILLLLNDTYGVYSVGDSRVYLKRGSQCDPITKDDVWQNQHFVQTTYTPSQIRENPNYGKLTRAVGTDKVLACSMQSGKLLRGDLFALCSDGVYKMCSSLYLEEMLSVYHEQDLDFLRDTIMHRVYQRGAADNASLILVRYAP